MISELAKSIAHFFTEEKLIDSEDEEVYAYGAELLLSPVFNMMSAVVIALITNTFCHCLVFFTSFVTIRIYAGGYHADTHRNCMLTLVCVQGLFVLIIKNFGAEKIKFFVPIMLMLSIAVIIWLAPVAHPNKPLTEKLKKVLRKKAYVSVAIWTLVTLVCTYAFNNSFGFYSALGMITISIALAAEKIKLGRNLNEKSKEPICS